MRSHWAAIVAIGMIACRSAPVWTARSPDHRILVTVVERAGRACIRVGARDAQCHDALALEGLVFSRDGRHVAYPALAGEQWAVVRNDTAGGQWNGIGTLIFNRDGSRLAYAALRGNRWQVVVNESAGPAFDAIAARTLAFDSTGRRLAYAGVSGDSTHVVIDGRRGPGWEGVAQIAFDAPGDRFAYLGRRGGRVHAVIDGEVGPPHDHISAIALAPSGSGHAYAARDAGRWSVITSGRRGSEHHGIRALRYMPGTDRLTWVARSSAGREAVLMDEVARVWHDSVEAPSFARDGSRWGYIAHDGAASTIIVDGAPVAREPAAADLTFGAGHRMAWVARSGDSVVVADDRGRRDFDLVVTGTLQFLDGGSRWVCLVGDRDRRQLRVVVDGLADGRRFDWAEITRLLGSDPSEETLRGWVAAEGELMIAGRGGAGREDLLPARRLPPVSPFRP